MSAKGQKRTLMATNGVVRFVPGTDIARSYDAAT